MLDTFDPNCDYCSALERREKHTAHWIADRRTVTTFEWLDNELAVILFGLNFFFDPLWNL